MNKTALNISLKKLTLNTESSHECKCGNPIATNRYALGYTTCLPCGETSARKINHTIVPMPKSNYIVVTDKSLLIGLNSSHKGSK